jgi:hypothetical protein
MSDDGYESPDTESEEVVDQDDLPSNNNDNERDTKEKKQLFIRDSGNNQSNSKVPLPRISSSSAIPTESSNNPDILSRRSSERRLTVSPTRSTTTSTSLTSKPEEGPQLNSLASPLVAANNIRSTKRNDRIDPSTRSNQRKITRRKKLEPEITKMEISNPNSKIVTKNEYIVSIGVYNENKKGFYVSVYENIDDLNALPRKELTDSTKTTFIKTTNTQIPHYKHFITIGTMNNPTIGAMAFGTSIQILKENAFKIWLKDPTKQNNVREMVYKIETNIDISKDFLPNIKYIGYGDIAEMHVLNSDNSDDEDDFNLNLPLTELQFNNQINHSSS